MHTNILAQLEPGIKPEQEFQQSEQLEEEGRCRHCGSGNLKSGAGKKGGEQSIHCADCRKFLEYQPMSQLRQLKRRKKLTESLELLESQNIRGESTQLFILSAIKGGEA
jgi:transposase-like protein